MALGCINKVPITRVFFFQSKQNNCKSYIQTRSTLRQIAFANVEGGPFNKALLFFNYFLIILKKFFAVRQ